MKRLEDVLSYTTGHLRERLDEEADVKDSMSWLFSPWDSLKGRVVVVAHIDTVHDKTVQRNRGYPTPKTKPDYYRTVGITTHECIRDGETGEYRRAKDSALAYSWVGTTAIRQNPGAISPINKAKVVEPCDKWRDFDLFYDSQKKVYWSPNGLGADDRAGVWGAYKLYSTMPKTFQPALLLTDGEESGCIGAREAVQSMGDTLKDAIGFIEFDRKGYKDAVYYSKEPDDWKALFAKRGFEESSGTTSDVSVLGSELRICTVNLSIGYLNHHRETEHLYETVAKTNIGKAEQIIRELTALGKQWENRKRKATTAIGYTGAWGEDYYDEWGFYEQEQQELMTEAPNNRGRFYNSPTASKYMHGALRHRKLDDETDEFVDVHPPERWNEYASRWEETRCFVADCTKCDDQLRKAVEEQEEEEEETLGPMTIEEIAYDKVGSYGSLNANEVYALEKLEPWEITSLITNHLKYICTVCNLLFGEEYYTVETEGWCPMCGMLGEDSERIISLVRYYGGQTDETK